MEKQNRSPVRGRSSRGRGPSSLWGSLFLFVFSLPFAGVGAAVLWIVPRFDKTEFPWPFKFMFGGIFFGVGVLMAFGALRSVYQHYQRKSLAEKYPNQPWMLDYDWDVQGAIDSPAKKTSNLIIGGLAFAAFMVPFNWLIVSEGAWKFVFPAIVVGIFDCIVLFLFGLAGYHLIQAFKYGSSKIRFGKFPFFLGETMDLEWTTERPIGAFSRININLCCVEEFKTRDSDGDSKTEFREIYRQELPIEQAGVQESVVTLPISLQLPDQPPLGTKITTLENARYWELEIHADTPGVDYSAVFLVPVYAKLVSASALAN
ncbi:MAG TPA: hypothetical protein VGP72_08190 [Planctomycetota bacterium]|jgi:hypothetical protein